MLYPEGSLEELSCKIWSPTRQPILLKIVLRNRYANALIWLCQRASERVHPLPSRVETTVGKQSWLLLAVKCSSSLLNYSYVQAFENVSKKDYHGTSSLLLKKGSSERNPTENHRRNPWQTQSKSSQRSKQRYRASRLSQVITYQAKLYNERRRNAQLAKAQESLIPTSNMRRICYDDHF